MVCGDLFRARDQKVYRGLVLARDPAFAVVYRLFTAGVGGELP